MTALPSLPPVGRDREVPRRGSGACRWWRWQRCGNGRPEERRPDPGRLDPITSLPNRRQFHADAGLLGQRPRHAGPDHAGRRRRSSTRSCACSATPAPTPSSAPAPQRLRRDPRARHRDLPRQPAELRLPPARPRRARPAGDDRPRRRQGFREPILCDDVPIDTRIGIGLKALGRAGGSPGEDLRATLSAAQDSRGVAHAAGPGSTARATRRTAAPSACSPTSRRRSTPRASSSCTTSPR